MPVLDAIGEPAHGFFVQGAQTLAQGPHRLARQTRLLVVRRVAQETEDMPAQIIMQVTDNALALNFRAGLPGPGSDDGLAGQRPQQAGDP